MDRRQFIVTAAAAPFALRAGLAAAQPAGGTPVALVTCDTQARIAVVDFTTMRVLRSIETLPGPRSIERSLDSAIVAHTREGALTLIGPDLESIRVIRGFDEPRYTAVDPWTRHAFVSDSGAHEIAVLDHRGRTLARVGVAGPARHLSLRRPGTRLLWSALGSKAEQIAILDLDNPGLPRRKRSIAPPFRAHDVKFTPDGRHVWVTSGDQHRLAIYTADGHLIRTLAADGPPQHVSFLDDHAYVTSGTDGTLTIHDSRTGRALRRQRIPVGSHNVQTDLRFILTPSLDTGALTIATTTKPRPRSLEVSPSSHDVCFAVA